MWRMRTRSTLALVAPTAAALAVALAACGGGGGTAAGKSEQEKFQEAALKHAACMRRHGVDVPDPKPNGGLIMSDQDVNPEEFERAVEACDKEVGKMPEPQLSQKEQREFRDAALKHARCMRAHGIDMPDPTFGANGTAQIEIGPGGGGPPLDDPAFKAANEKCQKYLGGGMMPGNPGG
jgi:hypothetical protein